VNVTREMLMAYADGELDEIGARQVERAIAEDSQLARQLEAERALGSQLRDHFPPIADEPVPQAWTDMIAAAAEEDGKVVGLAEARRERAATAAVPRWGTGIAIAASLVLGVMLGTQLSREGPVAESDGALFASANLKQALDTQLASDPPEGIRMLASFQRESGEYCRVFSGAALSGIACHADKGWRIERLRSGGEAGTAQYRQAGSAEAELMAAAQDMAAGEPLDAAEEEAARSQGWR
jgi:hypothetical protein